MFRGRQEGEQQAQSGGENYLHNLMLIIAAALASSAQPAASASDDQAASSRISPGPGSCTR